MTRILLVSLVLALVTSVASAGKDGPGTKAVKSANDTIAGLLAKDVEAGSQEEKDLAAKVTESVRSFLDVDMLGERALTDHWSTLSDTQKTEFLELLRGLIEDNYVKGLRANLEYKVKYKSEAKQDDGTRLVKTEIKTKRRGRPLTVKVDYVLEQSGKSWKAFDVVTDGVSLVENYRAQFNKIIAKDGFDGLLSKMKKKRSA
jgi:phospholipid transport system substrate-binding protein